MAIDLQKSSRAKKPLKGNRLSSTFPRMGGEFSFTSFSQSPFSDNQIKKLFEEAAEEVLRIENKMTDFKESPFNEINKYAGRFPVPVDDEILSLVNKSLQISRESEGLFDISYASLGHLWREARSRGQKLTWKQRKEAKKYINYQWIEVNEREKTIYLPYKEMRIGLGGIGKGYAVDRAYEMLRGHGLSNFYINGSGDVRVHSAANAPRRWKVGVRNPFSENQSQMAGAIQLANGAVATSGGYIRKMGSHKNSHLDHHIIETKSGLSRGDLISVTVIGKEAISCDTLGTILMNLSVTEALEELNLKGLCGILIEKNGKTHLSRKALENFAV